MEGGGSSPSTPPQLSPPAEQNLFNSPQNKGARPAGVGGGGLSAEGVLVGGGKGYKMVAKVATKQNGRHMTQGTQES